MMTDVVLHAPEEHEGRYKKKSIAARPQHPSHLAEPGPVIIEMLDHVESGDQIKRTIFIRQALGFTESYILQTALPAKIERLGGNVDAFSGAELRKHFQVR